MENTAEYVQRKLLEMRDIKYRDFHSRLIPGTDPETVIGVRTPVLRKFASEFGKTEMSDEFLNILPHKYYEENNLHGFLIEKTKDFGKCISRLEKFLPFIDNWATCDLINPAVFRKNLPLLLPKAMEWIGSEHTYTIRFGMGMLMRYWLDEEYSEEYPSIIAAVRSDEYYVNMMRAWYFATALAKQYDSAVVYLEANRLDVWTHNKTIQKAAESFRVTDEHKAYLKTLKR
ncbi:MAG: DNA alkylation repair protein [Porcipelethomonas sp.]